MERYDTVMQFADAFAAALKPTQAVEHQPTAFISYRRMPSAMLASLIATKLQLHGINVYVDTRKLDGGGPFPSRLLAAIEQCDVFVCLVADSTFESDWVRQEVEHAAKLGKAMIPVFQESYTPLQKSEIPAPFVETLLRHDGIHIFDIKNVYIDEAIHNLTQMVKETCER